MFESQRFALGLALLAIGTSASAQSALSGSASGSHENRLRVGIVVPFGNAGRASEHAPRLEAWSEQRSERDTSQLRLRSDQDRANTRQVRFGMTLGQQPRLMINGREAAPLDSRHGVSALGTVGIVLGVAVAVVGLAAVGAFGHFSN